MQTRRACKLVSPPYPSLVFSQGVLGGYFGASRSFAQFHLPHDLKLLDSRSPTSTITGPLVSFAGPVSNHIFLLCPSGVFCELSFDLNKGQECTLLTASTWFAPRPNFQIQVSEGAYRERMPHVVNPIAIFSYLGR